MNKMYKTVVVGVLLLCCVLGVCGCKSDVSYQYVDMYIFETEAALQEAFEEHGLEYGYDNTVEQYESIAEHLKGEDVYVYYRALGTIETDKICQVLGYESLDGFMIQKGYVDKDGEPSLEKLRDESYVWMTKELAKRK